MFHGLTSDALATVLSGVAPADLLGLELLRRLQPEATEWFPTDAATDELVAATTQLIEYTQSCRDTAQRLETLPPVPVTAMSVEEFSL